MCGSSSLLTNVTLNQGVACPTLALYLPSDKVVCKHCGVCGGVILRQHNNVNVTSERSLGMIGLSPRSQRGSWAQACCRSPGPQPRLTLLSGGLSVLVHRRHRCSGSGKRPGRLLSLQPPPSSPPLPGGAALAKCRTNAGAAELCAACSCSSRLPAPLHWLGDADRRGGACRCW